MPVNFCLNAESCSCEDFRLFLEGSSHKHEQTQFCGTFITFCSFFFLSPNFLVDPSFTWNIWQVNVRSFGHRNPLEEYKIDGCRFFISVLSATRRLTVESLLRYWSSPMETQEIFFWLYSKIFIPHDVHWSGYHMHWSQTFLLLPNQSQRLNVIALPCPLEAF